MNKINKIKHLLISILLLSYSNLFPQKEVAKKNDKPEVSIGGALRFNYNLSSWKEGQQARGGDFGFDVFRINAKAQHKGLKLNAEYRFYAESFGGGMLKQGWLGYNFNAHNELQLGLTQVPFGNTTYNSYSWFFSLNYYVGLEDDHDMGVKWVHRNENWDFDLAFFKNAEELRFGSSSDVSNSRYAYDVGSLIAGEKGEYRNKETNQISTKAAYKFGKRSSHKLGASALFGGLYNLETMDMGNHYAVAGHYEMNMGKFSFKAQGTYYKYNPKAPRGENTDFIAMTAYGAPYLVATEAVTFTLGAGYNVAVNWGPVSGLQFYNDFGLMDKMADNFEKSLMNALGVLITAGNVYTYIDYAIGKNQPWIGSEWTNGLGSGNPDAEWEARLNINIGYYF